VPWWRWREAASPLIEEVQSLASVPLASAGETGIDVAAPFDPERLARIDFEALKRRLLDERVFRRRLLSEDGRTTVLALRVRDEFYGDAYRKAVVAPRGRVLGLGRSRVELLVSAARDRCVGSSGATTSCSCGGILLSVRPARAVPPRDGRSSRAGLGASLVFTWASCAWPTNR
jgi:hypothetical protein